jgi:pimeloyl-ACP methyl ester carboxylesterase
MAWIFPRARKNKSTTTEFMAILWPGSETQCRLSARRFGTRQPDAEFLLRPMPAGNAISTQQRRGLAMMMNLWSKWMTDWSEYWVDAAQRSVLFMDILRQRGNNYLAHLKNDQPPVLIFDYETVIDGRTLDRPVNYALVRIRSRRSDATPDRRRLSGAAASVEERRCEAGDRRHKTNVADTAPEAVSRPIVIFDPRAGHGPGIGGSKTDSQIGMALDAGHPVYFLVFSTTPEPGQTLTDVRNAQIRFVEEVRRRHPAAPRPAIIGNCQGGWAAALVGAERPDLVGPMVFNGSPLSYWAGVEGVNPMRYLGGLCGGVWITSFLGDIGDGIFDGANLVANFENLNPANSLWAKNYHVYANADTEASRFLEFEKWWGGFFLMTAAEIHQIVEGLFIGNRLEQGEFTLDGNHAVDLKRNANPVVLFASFGDNITPPQQAFNWIYKPYGSIAEIKRRGQVIVYIVHSKIGHLGIFVSAKIARKEHKSIIASFDMLYHLAPGLYEMHIEPDPAASSEYKVSYVEKTMDDILAMDDGLADEEAFLSVRQVSVALDSLYRQWVSPWIRAAISPATAETLRQLHPLRVSRYSLSDMNPLLFPVAAMAEQIRADRATRRPVADGNPYRSWEKTLSSMIVDTLDRYRDTRDGWSELMFKAFYANPWLDAYRKLTEAPTEMRKAA